MHVYFFGKKYDFFILCNSRLDKISAAQISLKTLFRSWILFCYPFCPKDTRVRSFGGKAEKHCGCLVLFSDSTISKLLWIRREYLVHIKFLLNLMLLLFCFILEPGVSVNCSDIITIALEKKTFPFFDVARLHLRYSSCRATQNDTHLLIRTPLNGCGTLVNETEDDLFFWNEIRTEVVLIDNVITRSHDVKIPFYCSYSRRKWVNLGFKPQHLHFGTEGKWNFPALVLITPNQLHVSLAKVLSSQGRCHPFISRVECGFVSKFNTSMC